MFGIALIPARAASNRQVRADGIVLPWAFASTPACMPKLGRNLDEA